MATGATYETLVDARAVGSEVVRSDYYTIPGAVGSGTVSYRTIELPLDAITAPSLTNPIYVQSVDAVTHVATGTIFTMVTAPTTPLAGQFQIDTTATFSVGTILFSQFDAGTTVQITYTGRGSLVFAEDINNSHDELTAGRAGLFDIDTRMSDIENGTRIADASILPRHISTTATDAYTFPGDVTVDGDLDVKGTLTYIESTTVNIGDQFINLNKNETGTPTLDAGINVTRGTSPTVTFAWREATQSWELTTGTLKITAGDLNISGLYQVGGVQISSADLSNDALLIKTTTALGGDLSGNLPSASVAKIQGYAVAATAPSASDALIWNATNSDWEPTAVVFPTSFVDGEIATRVAGPPVTYTLANTPATGSLHLFWNGVRQEYGSDYTLAGNTITFTVTPGTSDIILADYRI